MVLFALPLRLEAGGSGLNTLVIVNQNSSNSCEAANYFCERRQVPPENVLRINWPGGNVAWTNTDFQTYLLTPLLTMLTARQLTNQIDYVVLSMDIPFQTYFGNAVNSTTAALFYGLKDTIDLTNSYGASEQIFSQAHPATAPGYSFLATMLTANSLAEAKQMVDQGVNSDGTFPTQTVLLAKSSDTVRNIRYKAFDNALFNTRLCGGYSVARTNTDAPWTLSNLMGFETGMSSFFLTPGTFAPGAIADSMTSYAGLIFGGSGGQTTELAFIGAGAAGSYGTVTEPGSAIDKFPSPQIYFYQARGFSLAECYYQSLNVPYEGLVVGEPLAAPCQRQGTGSWVGITSNALLSGTAQISAQFAAATPQLPLQAIDLFVDGKFLRTLTNVTALTGNQLSVRLNGNSVSYTVPVGATLASAASGLATLINNPATTNVTKTMAFVHGDRIELHSMAGSRLPPPTFLGIQGPSAGTNSGTAQTPGPTSSSIGSAGSLTTFLTASRNVFLDSPSKALKACSVYGTLQVGDWVRLSVRKVNGTVVNVAATNQSASGTPYSLAGQLFTNINAAASLQAVDGVSAEDFISGLFGGGQFNLIARNPGLGAAGIQITFTGSGGLMFTPAATSNLDDNLGDVQPRNHLYVRAGVTNLAMSFPLATTALADGFHELAAVAYEGSHIRTQTRITLPVRVQNSPLSATMTLVDLAATNSVQGTYHIQVTANTNNVSSISLFSTGGILATATNQASASFTVNGPTLGVGLHQFYSLVQTASGLTYRTQPQWVRLVPGP
jgi:uncharacterized protein (TIGR03790 family)